MLGKTFLLLARELCINAPAIGMAGQAGGGGGRLGGVLGREAVTAALPGRKQPCPRAARNPTAWGLPPVEDQSALRLWVSAQRASGAAALGARPPRENRAGGRCLGEARTPADGVPLS